MMNCPNCGAPYALDKPVCEYCGTVREDLEDGGEWIEQKNILGETFRYYEPRRLFDPTQQTACGAQALADAASSMTCSLRQARINAEFDVAQREQTTYAYELLQARIEHSKAAQYAEDFLRTLL